MSEPKPDPQPPDPPVRAVSLTVTRQRPDTGWSWVVLAGSFLSLMIMSTIYTAGLFNIIFLEVFGMNKQVTAWVGAMPGSLMSILGKTLLSYYHAFSRELVQTFFLVFRPND